MSKESFMIMGVSERNFYNAKINDHITSLHGCDLKVFKFEGKEYVGVRIAESENVVTFMKNVNKATDKFYELAIGGLQNQTPVLYTIK